MFWAQKRNCFSQIFSLNPEAVTLKKLWQKSCNLRRENIAILQAKGQLVSKDNFGVFKSRRLIGGSKTAIILWKPNKSLFEGSTSVGMHGQKFCLLFRFLDFVTVLNLAYCLCWADSCFLASKRKWVGP